MKLNVFFSWQMETDLQGIKTKGFLKDCINSAIKSINNKGELKGVWLELHEGLERVPGNADIAIEMFRQIDDCDIFIGDFTIVQKIHKCGRNLLNKHGVYFRYTPNCNVYGEYNRALGKTDDFWKQVVLLMNDVNGNPNDDVTIIPFDARGRRWPILFTLKENTVECEKKAKEELLKILPLALQMSAKAAIASIERRFAPFVSWYEQKKDKRLNFSIIKENDVNKHKDTLLKFRKVLRVVGPKSLSKTILVNKAFEDTEVMNNYLYTNYDDCGSDDVRKKILFILKELNNLTIVVDNCPDDLFDYILNQKKRFGSNNRIITISVKDAKNVSTQYEYEILDLSESMKDSVAKTFQEKEIATSRQELILKYCQDNPMLVNVIVSNIQTGDESEKFDDEEITTKLVGYMPGSIERKILQSLAMFKYVGWKEERSKELDYVLSNKSITSVDKDVKILHDTAVEIIRRGVSLEIIEERGRTFSITHEPLAKQLIKEWLLSVDEKRMVRFIETISDGNHNWLIKEFHDRFIAMSDDAGAKQTVAELFKIGNVFERSEVLDTESGSLFVETFAEISPDVVNELLYRFVKSRSSEQVKQIKEGRRNIVWTLAHLCFIPELFAKSAEAMLMLAAAENEEVSNNATGNFISLFPVMLPATSVSLDKRLQFLQEMMKKPSYKQIIMRALARATLTRDFIYFRGAETLGGHESQNYVPQTKTEISIYIEGCLSLIKNEIKSDSVIKSEAIKVIEDNTITLCDSGYASLVLPIVKDVSCIQNNKWERMRHTLSLFRNKLQIKMTKEEIDKYDAIINLLTTNDVVSKYVRIEKECFYTDLKMPFEEQQRQKQDKYKALAGEMISKSQLSKDIIREIACSDVIADRIFGETLATQMSSEEQLLFIRNYVEICNTNKNSKSGILADFVAKVGDDVFRQSIETLLQCRLTYTVFACMARRNILPSDALFSVLNNYIQNKNAHVADFNHYWNNMRFDLITDEFVVSLFDNILKHNGGFCVVMHIALSLAWRNMFENSQILVDTLAKIYIDNTNIGTPVTEDYQQLKLLVILLQNDKQISLAQHVNAQIIAAAANPKIIFSIQYDLESIYRLLMKNYFGTIWPSLSKALLSEDDQIMTYIHLKALLGCSFNDGGTPIIMEGNHFKEMIEWCGNNPDIAPARLAGLIPVAIGDKFTLEAKFLIDKYADKQYVLNEIACTLDSFSSVGSIVPYYERRERIYSSLLQHKDDSVRQWAQQHVNSCKYMVRKEKEREAEMRLYNF